MVGFRSFLSFVRDVTGGLAAAGLSKDERERRTKNGIKYVCCKEANH